MDFSIIIPAFKAGSTIKRTIESVLNQTYQSFEIIIIDDGSPDDELEIISKSFNDNRIQYYKYNKNGRQGKARNYGLKIAKGKYIVFLDADDTLHSSMLKSIQKSFEKSNSDLIFFGQKRIFENKKRPKIIMPNSNYLEAISSNHNNRILLDATPTACAYNRNFLEINRLNFVEGLLFEDIHFVVKTMICATTYDIIEKPFYNYFIRHQSTVRSANCFNNMEALETFKVLIRELKMEDHYISLKNEIEFLAVKYLKFEAKIRILTSKCSNRDKKRCLQRIDNFMLEEFPDYYSNMLIKSHMKLHNRLILFLLEKNKTNLVRIVALLGGY